MDKCICTDFEIMRISTYPANQDDSVEDQIHKPNHAELKCKGCGRTHYEFGRVKHIFENGKLQHVFTYLKYRCGYEECIDIPIEEN